MDHLGADIGRWLPGYGQHVGTFYKSLKKLKKMMSEMHGKDFLAKWKSKMIENDLAVFIQILGLIYIWP